MSLSPPLVYIGTELMNNHAYASVPMLAGLKFEWGTDNLVEFADAKTCSASLLVRTPENLDFLATGTPFGVLDPDTGATLFAGRISTLRARPDSRKKSALLISLTAVDTLDDLQQYRVERIDWYRPGDTVGFNGADRRNQLASVMPAGWTLAGAGINDAWANVRPQRWTAAPILPLIDMYLRTVLGRRHVTTRYVPGTGLVPSLTITHERDKTARVDKLRADAAGAWYMLSTPPTSSAYIQLTGRHAAADIEWEKTPDDTITDVALTSHGLGFGTVVDGRTGPDDESSTFELWVNSYLNVDNRAVQAKYGVRTLQLDVDTLGGDARTNPLIGTIVNYWVDVDAQWRPTSIVVPDSRRLPDATARALLNVTTRHNAYLTLDGLQATNPAGGSRVRAFAIAGSAEWTGKKWVFELALGRVPRPAAAAGGLTFESIRNNPDPNISNATAATVGTALTFADFLYIGA